MIYENFYIKANVELLEVPLPLEAFKKEDGSYYTIPEYLANYGDVVTRFNKDKTMFIKGFGFTFKGVEEMALKLVDFGLIIDENFFVLSLPEVLEELNNPEWNVNEGG